VWSSIPCTNITDLGCGEIIENYVGGVQERPPTFLPWTTPGYANTGFLLFGRMLEHITGKTVDEIYRDSLFDPLNMINSNTSTPPESEWPRAAIPRRRPHTVRYPHRHIQALGRATFHHERFRKTGRQHSQ
jgi:CubicO group peptidase (beta-lactamase class C family)